MEGGREGGISSTCIKAYKYKYIWFSVSHLILCAYIISHMSSVVYPCQHHLSFIYLHIPGYKTKTTDEWFQRKSGKRDAEYKAAAIAMKDEMRDAMMSPEELEAKTRVGTYCIYVC